MNGQTMYNEPAKKLPVYGNYDVIVVGGGCAGFAAAIASARNGAKTLIIERFPYFGGTATASLMASANGFRNQVEPEHTQFVLLHSSQCQSCRRSVFYVVLQVTLNVFVAYWGAGLCPGCARYGGRPSMRCFVSVFIFVPSGREVHTRDRTACCISR